MKREKNTRRKNYYCGPMYKHWTFTAVKCYELGCNCSKCNLIGKLDTLSKDTCKMKQAVMELVREIGKPNIKRKDLIDEI